MSQASGTPFLPSFPVIVIHRIGNQLKAEAPGGFTSTEEIQENATVEQLNAAVSSCAVALAEQMLIKSNTRVTVIEEDPTTQYSMWLDIADGVVKPVEKPKVPKKKLFASWSRQQKILVFGGLAVVIAISGAFGVRAMIPQQKTQVVISAPPAAQLPVAAPAGWDTYADYAVDSSAVNPLLLDEQIVYAQGSSVKRMEASTGIATDSKDAGFQITNLYQSFGLGHDVIAASAGTSQVAVGHAGGALHQIEAPSESAKLLWVSGTPVYTTVGFVHVPDADGNLHRYSAPADSVPAVVTPDGVWMVSTISPQAWFITNDSPNLPTAKQLLLGAGEEVTGDVVGVGNSFVVGIRGENQDYIQVFDTTGQNIVDTRTIPEVSLSAHPIVDPYRHILLGTNAMVDITSDHAVPVAGGSRYGAGFAWVSGIENQRVSISGEKIPWRVGKNNSSSAVIPDAVLEDGRAVVLFRAEGSRESSRIYVLRAQKGGENHKSTQD